MTIVTIPSPNTQSTITEGWRNLLCLTGSIAPTENVFREYFFKDVDKRGLWNPVIFNKLIAGDIIGTSCVEDIDIGNDETANVITWYPAATANQLLSDNGVVVNRQWVARDGMGAPSRPYNITQTKTGTDVNATILNTVVPTFAYSFDSDSSTSSNASISALRSDLTALSNDVDTNSESISSLSTITETLTTTTTNLVKAVTDVDVKVNSMEEVVASVSSDVATLKTAVDSLTTALQVLLTDKQQGFLYSDGTSLIWKAPSTCAQK